MREHFSIAIDGPSGAGKSSLARRCAEAFHFVYVDTGAIYRTVGLGCVRAGVSPRDAEAVRALLPQLCVELQYQDGEQRMLLNGEDVSDEIRRPEISITASDVSSLPAVREFLLQMQRDLAKRYDVIMDGRDIGTVVLPQADLKIFLTASPEARAERRLKELQAKGVETSTEEVLRDILYRDQQDTTREIAPLRQAEDAIPVDTTELDFDESFRVLCGVIVERLSQEGNV